MSDPNAPRERIELAAGWYFDVDGDAAWLYAPSGYPKTGRWRADQARTFAAALSPSPAGMSEIEVAVADLILAGKVYQINRMLWARPFPEIGYDSLYKSRAVRDEARTALLDLCRALSAPGTGGMRDDGLEKLRALSERATPGPWRHSLWQIERGSAIRCDDGRGHIVANTGTSADADLVAAAVNFARSSLAAAPTTPTADDASNPGKVEWARTTPNDYLRGWLDCQRASAEAVYAIDRSKEMVWLDYGDHAEEGYSNGRSDAERSILALRPPHASDCALHNGPALTPQSHESGADPSMTPEIYGSGFSSASTDDLGKGLGQTMASLQGILANWRDQTKCSSRRWPTCAPMACFGVLRTSRVSGFAISTVQ